MFHTAHNWSQRTSQCGRGEHDAEVQVATPVPKGRRGQQEVWKYLPGAQRSPRAGPNNNTLKAKSEGNPAHQGVPPEVAEAEPSWANYIIALDMQMSCGQQSEQTKIMGKLGVFHPGNTEKRGIKVWSDYSNTSIPKCAENVGEVALGLWVRWERLGTHTWECNKIILLITRCCITKWE